MGLMANGAIMESHRQPQTGDRKAVQSVLHMSASGHERTKSDIRATSDLPSTSEMIRDRPHDRNVPFPDKRIANELLLDHLVSLSKQCGWYGEAERSGGLQIDHDL